MSLFSLFNFRIIIIIIKIITSELINSIEPPLVIIKDSKFVLISLNIVSFIIRDSIYIYE